MKRIDSQAAVLVAAVLAAGCRGSDAPRAQDAALEPRGDRGRVEWVGREACAECHQEEVAAWRGSHHDLAMQPADASTVLGDFGGATFAYGEVTSTFLRRDDGFFVRTDGPDGELREVRVAYTFGVEPLQQYLVELPGGRLQALSICWDTRPANAGGQRWFHLYPDEVIDHEDILHWTGLYQNWNHMCAECHSTNVDKGYIAGERRYETTFSEVDVSCEACHGPASRHVEWARRLRALGGDGATSQGAPDLGLVVDLEADTPGVWQFEPGSAIASRSAPRASHREVESCGRCHSRRSPLAPRYAYGEPLAESYRIALLEPPLYYADGQVRDEVYVYGSFLQSKMYRRGVTCSDCHDPHSLKLRGSGNVVCSTCHSAAVFDAPEHHHHQPETRGASCAECHMPPTTFMVVDPRHDHSFRVPRPELSVELGVPNACNRCHDDRPPAWAVETLSRWYGARVFDRPEYARALDAGRRRLLGAEQQLLAVATDGETPAIARASALAELSGVLSPRSLPVLRRALEDPDPLVRTGAATATRGLDPARRIELLRPRLADAVRMVRLEAANGLASLSRDHFDAAAQAEVDLALAELSASQLLNADRPEAHLGLGALYAGRGELEHAEREYLEALELEPRFPATYVNLADLYRMLGRDGDGERLLRRGLEIAPANADLLHSLGLTLVRQRRLAEATEALAQAAALAPEIARYGYVYAVALDSQGQTERALAVLEQCYRRHPGDPDLLFALATMNRDRGDAAAALTWAERLLELAPEDPGARQLHAQLAAAGRAQGPSE